MFACLQPQPPSLSVVETPKSVRLYSSKKEAAYLNAARRQRGSVCHYFTNFMISNLTSHLHLAIIVPGEKQRMIIIKEPDITNREFKDSFFKKVFEGEQRIIELASFFTGTEVKSADIITVNPVLFGNKENDLSFIIDKSYYYILECQSTYNPNMPFRVLQYMITAWNNYVDEKVLYGKAKASLKVPKLYTLFTGCCKNPPNIVVSEQKLSSLLR